MSGAAKPYSAGALIEPMRVWPLANVRKQIPVFMFVHHIQVKYMRLIIGLVVLAAVSQGVLTYNCMVNVYMQLH